jgi:hypothetical protein
MKIKVEHQEGRGMPLLVRASTKTHRQYREVCTGLRFNKRIVRLVWIPF